MMKQKLWAGFAAICLSGALLAAGCGGQTAAPAKAPAAKAEPANKAIILSTTTSTRDSGLLDALLPVFEQESGYKVKVIAVGTGQALKMGEQGEADVLLVHAPEAEKKVLAGGAAVNRKLVTHNDFVVVGPKADPAGIAKQPVGSALRNIAQAKAAFVSRGDDSGTHKMELALWKKAGVPTDEAWYRAAGAGMGQTLKIADERQGYTLTDRATWLALQKNMTLSVLVEGDPSLLNIYHVMEVNSEKFAKVNKAGAQAFSQFLLSPKGQQMIAEFGKDKYGQALFFADGGKTEVDLGVK